ncbi:MAG: hypothetical protein AAF558_11125 [Verrucomicrobiota bacterium]
MALVYKPIGREHFERVLAMDGALAIALGETVSGLCFEALGDSGFDLSLAIEANNQVIRAQESAMKRLQIHDDIQDMLICLQNQYHVIALVPHTSMFVYLVLDREKGNLAMARHALSKLVAKLR